jgi:CheY-like chemotaxis protein
MEAEQDRKVPDKRYILIVDPNRDDCARIGNMLQKFGYGIWSAHTAAEALDSLCVAPPLGIIADASMKGLTLLSLVIRDARFSGVPMILLSSSPDRSLKARVSRGEFSACLKKPVNCEEFYRAIQSYILNNNARKNIRIVTSLKALAGGEASRVEGLVTTLSEFGLFFRVPDLLPAETRLPIHFEIKGKTISLEAVVLYSCSSGEGPFREQGMGMKFVKISPQDRALIKAYILEEVNAGIPG